MLEYIDMLTMASATAYVWASTGIPDDAGGGPRLPGGGAGGDHADRVDADAEAVAEMLAGLGAIDVYVLPPGRPPG